MALSPERKQALLNRLNELEASLQDDGGKKMGVKDVLWGMATGGLPGAMINKQQEAYSQGLNKKDMPYIVQEALSGLTGGATRSIMQRPLEFAMGGLPGAQITVRKGGDEWIKPDSEGGRQMGEQAEILTGLIPFGGTASKVAQQAGKASKARAIKNLTKDNKKWIELAKEMKAHIKTAKDKAWEPYKAYLEKHGKDIVDQKSFDEFIEILPADFKKGLLNDPNITKKVMEIEKMVPSKILSPTGGKIMTKTTEKVKQIEPTLENVKYARDVARGKVPSNYFGGIKQKYAPVLEGTETSKDMAKRIYGASGDVMKQGRNELAGIMDEYGNFAKARDTLDPMLQTKFGYYKPTIRTFYKQGSGSVAPQAIEDISKFNPEIMDTALKSKKLANQIARQRALRGLVEKFGWGTAIGIGGAMGLRPKVFVEGFGGDNNSGGGYNNYSG